MSTSLGNLKRLNPRIVWKSESHDFTPWLAQNIQKLGDILGMDLETINTEVSVGDYSADILAKDLGTNKDVVIENQFGWTDHDHLGKLLTYASGMDAGTLIWIAEGIRDEHRQALEWLNERTDTETMLFAIVLEILQIDESAPAINFKPIVFPNKWQKRIREKNKGEITPRGEAYRKFFQVVIDELRNKYKFTGAKVAQPQSWYTYRSGFTGIDYGTSFSLGGRARVELYIDQGDIEKNKRFFDWLLERRDQIEAGVGQTLEWERLEEKRASRIALYRSGTIDDDHATLGEIQKWMVEQVLMFKKVFTPLINVYKNSGG